MNKNDFLTLLRVKLTRLPKSEIDDRINFYSEMIDDKIENGLSESEAVLQIGSLNDIADEILAEFTSPKESKEGEKIKPKSNALKITLIALGSPLWIALMATVFSVAISLIVASAAIVISVYAVLWVLLISLFAIEGALIGCAVGLPLGGVALILTDNAISGFALLGTGIFSSGLAIFLFFALKASTKATLSISKRVYKSVKYCFRRRKI